MTDGATGPQGVPSTVLATDIAGDWHMRLKQWIPGSEETIEPSRKLLDVPGSEETKESRNSALAYAFENNEYGSTTLHNKMQK